MEIFLFVMLLDIDANLFFSLNKYLGNLSSASFGPEHWERISIKKVHGFLQNVKETFYVSNSHL